MSKKVEENIIEKDKGEISTNFEDDFIYIKVVGKGSYGTVHKARRKLDNKIYAVKVTKFIDWEEIAGGKMDRKRN